MHFSSYLVIENGFRLREFCGGNGQFPWLTSHYSKLQLTPLQIIGTRPVLSPRPYSQDQDFRSKIKTKTFPSNLYQNLWVCYMCFALYVYGLTYNSWQLKRMCQTGELFIGLGRSIVIRRRSLGVGNWQDFSLKTKAKTKINTLFSVLQGASRPRPSTVHENYSTGHVIMPLVFMLGVMMSNAAEMPQCKAAKWPGCQVEPSYGQQSHSKNCSLVKKLI